MRTLLVLAFFVNLVSSTTILASESKLWQQFVEAKASGAEPTLPDFSYAGYSYSETAIPDVSSWKIFNVTDYGAIANDGLYDDIAIQKTINAAENAGGGVVLFSVGRFMVSPNENVGENIFIRASNIILKGSSEGTTEIFMDKMKVKNGRHIFEVGPGNKRETTLTKVVKEAQRESYQITVENASKLTIGQKILLSTNSIDFAKTYYAPQKLALKWTNLTSNKGFRLRELHTVAEIEGNQVTLREPLHTTLYMTKDAIKVKSYPMISNIGIEGILFKGNWDSYPEDFIHHKDDIHDYAWNAIRFDNVENGWIRDCEFKDWNQVLFIDGSAALTIESLKITGKKGHLAIHQRRSYGVLVQDIVDLAGHHHGPSVGYSNAGAVYLRYQMYPEQRIDSHSGSPYATLMDGVVNGQIYGNGGPHKNYPHHGKGFVFWNFVLGGGPERYNFWREKRNGNTFAMPYFIGLQGKKVSFTDGTYSANEQPMVAAEPSSLFGAQLALRLAKKTKSESVHAIVKPK